MADGRAFQVVIAGGGVAALEAALALHELAGDLAQVRLLAPDAELAYRPMTVGEPFSLPPARCWSPTVSRTSTPRRASRTPSPARRSSTTR